MFLLLLLVVGGALQDIRIFYFRAFGNTFHSGLVAYGSMSALVREMYSVEESLNQLGLEKNEPLLVLPHATSIYYWLNRENRLPHLQFFPKYIESYGADPKEVLKAYETRGGKFLLLQQNSSLSLFYPDIWSEIEKNYVELSRLDHYFSIFRKKY
ncbi:MAG: hypothetical protein M9962_04750 [Oligoflexia bacterium]|nr:hypothetical protein [Oligoflexia bacterium]